jgi:putative ABC transport system ATP-binding protein
MKKREITNKKIIELKNVKKHYHLGDSIVRAVDGISLKIGQGEFISIMGHSGSGKSTSMNLIGSLDIPTSGKILLDGIDISKLNESELASLRGRKVGFVFQNFNLIPNLSVLENVMLPMIFQDIGRGERIERAEELLREVGLGHRLNSYPKLLSGGEMQRVAVARALANDPDIILADEPTGNLDTENGEKIMALLERLNKLGKTIVIITHEPELAEEFCEKIYWLKDGKIEKIDRKKRK